MKIMLIRPPWSSEKFYEATPRESLGLEYLASYVKDRHEVELFDTVMDDWNNYWKSPDFPEVVFQGSSLDRIIDKIAQFQPDIIGLTWLLPTQTPGIELMLNKIFNQENKIKVMVGGPQPSSNPRDTLLKYPGIDMIIYGEGELTLLELLNNNAQNLDIIDGLAWRRKDEIIVNKPRALIKDLDILPFPLRDTKKHKNLALQVYFDFLEYRLRPLFKNEDLRRRIVVLISKIPYLNRFYYFLHNRRSLTDNLPFACVVTSRGCPNHCTFCAIHNTWGHNWRPRSAENVLKEIEFLVEKCGVKHINIVDDNFNFSPTRVIDICKGIVNRGYKITLAAPGVFAPTLNEEVLSWLKKAGIYSIRMSTESGNQDILNNIIKKHINLKQIAEVVKICKKLGIRTEGAFILGIPGETIQTMQDTINYAKETGFDKVVKFIYQPFPNTALYDICMEQGYLTPDFDSRRSYITGSKCYIKTDQFTPEDVLRIARS